jgi:hypothetical protein
VKKDQAITLKVKLMQLHQTSYDTVLLASKVYR